MCRLVLLVCLFAGLSSNGAMAGTGGALDLDERQQFAQRLDELREERSSLLHGAEGILVVEVMAGSTAEAARIVPGDFIVRYAGMPINDLATLTKAISQHAATSGSVEMVIIRDAANRVVKLASGRLGVGVVGVGFPTPQLRIEPGMHTSMIQGIAADAKGRYLVTASHDKTARVWSQTNGELIRTLRPPAGEGDQGKLYAVAMTPDGETVAVGGWTGESRSIYFFDRASGRISLTVIGLPSEILDLAFSPDGRYLAAGLFGRRGIRVFETASGKAAGEDRAIGGDVYSVAWAGAPGALRLAAGSADGKIRLWSLGASSLKKLAEAPAPAGRLPAGIAFSPDSRRLAVGYHNVKAVSLLDAQTLAPARPQAAPDMQGVGNGDLSSVEWSADGRALWAAGKLTRSIDGKTKLILRRWPVASDGRLGVAQETAIADNTVLSLVALPGGRLAFAAGDPAWGVVGADGRLIRFVASPLLDFRSNRAGPLELAPDGETMRIGTLGFDLAHRRLLPPGEPSATVLARPRQVAPGLEVKNWANKQDPSLNGQPLKLDQYEYSRSLGSAADGKGFVLGTDYWLRRFDTGGREVWRQPVPGTAWAVNIARDGRTVVAAYSNGTLQWHRYSDGEVLLSLFVHADNKRWIMWTPEGYYDASPGGEELIGWNFSRGTSESLFIPGSDLYDVFYRPDIVQAKIRGEDISGLVTLTVKQAFKNPPPEVAFTRIPAASSAAREKVCYKVTSTGGGIGEVRLFQNGKLVKSDGFYREAVARREDKLVLAANTGDAMTRSLRALKLKKQGLPVVPSAKKGETVEECQEIDAIPGENEFGVVAFNGLNTVQSRMATGSFNSSRPAEIPQLYVLGIGIDQFRDKSANLKYAAKDARDFQAMIKEKSGTLFRPEHVHLVPLADAEATKQGILGKIDELSSQIKPWDSFIVFVASHGVMLGNQYYLVSAGYDGTADTANLIGSNEIVELSKKIRSLNQLYVFDTCHAGGVDNIVGGLYDARMSVLAKKMGLHIYASAGGLQEALDGYQGNGLFTHTLLGSMREAAATDANRDGKVSVVELGHSAKEKTSVISTQIGHPQTPTMIHFGRDVPVFAVR